MINFVNIHNWVTDHRLTH